jgi:hypothetical protein
MLFCDFLCNKKGSNWKICSVYNNQINKQTNKQPNNTNNQTTHTHTKLKYPSKHIQERLPMPKSDSGYLPSILKENQDGDGKSTRRAEFSSKLQGAPGMRNGRRRGSNILSENSSISYRSKEDYFIRRSYHELKRNNVHYHVNDAVDASTCGSGTTVGSKLCLPENNILAGRIKDLLDHRGWKIAILFFTLVLIFGAPLQDLCPKAVDPYFYVVFIITFVILMIDIFMMCLVVPSYLRKTSDDAGWHCLPFQTGSLIFWFDLLSVLSFLYEMPGVNKALTRLPEIVVHLNSSGEPTNLTGANPLINFKWELILNVVARMARAVRLLHLPDSIDCVRSIFGAMIRFLNFEEKCFCNRHKISDQKKKEIKAAIVIQNAWRSRTVVGMFYAAGARHRAKTNNSDQQPPNNSDQQPPYVSQGDVENQKKINRLRKILSMPTSLASSHTGVQKKEKRRKKQTQIGNSMNEKTIRRVALGIIITFLFTVVFTYVEENASSSLTMVSIHNTLANTQQEDNMSNYANHLFTAARATSAKNLCEFKFGSGTKEVFYGCNLPLLRDKEMLKITVCEAENKECIGLNSTSTFDYQRHSKRTAIVSILFTIFFLLVWSFGRFFFVGPVTTLVISPIERMIRLLSILVKDPLGYSKTKKFKTFMREDHELKKNTPWSQESLNGMETAFLMSTILRIGEFECNFYNNLC